MRKSPGGLLRAEIAGLLFLWIAAMPLSAAAHPHVFIDNVVSFLFEKEQVVGIRLTWTFDEPFSSTVIEDFDQNGDGIFDPAEIQQVQAGAFSNLRDCNYFSHVWVDGREVTDITVRDFTAAASGGIVTYDFVLPLARPIEPAQHRLEAAIYDRNTMSTSPSRRTIRCGWRTNRAAAATTRSAKTSRTPTISAWSSRCASA